MIEFLKAQKETDEAIINSKFTEDELHRFSKSDSRWVANKGKTYQTRKVKKGEIYQFEFGKNYAPEMSYEHRGLVIGVKNKLLYVLPIYSYDSKKHTNVYHPIDFPNSKSDLYLLKNSEFSWINHDSILKLNDIRTVSINRVQYKHSGKIDSTTDTYKSIETLVFKKYFAEFHHEFENDKKMIETLKEDNTKLTEEVDELKSENQQLLEKIKSLKEKLKKTEAKT